MSIATEVIRHPTRPSMIWLLAVISTVIGCGVMPTGHVSRRNFNVTGFNLPAAMVYSNAADVRASFPGIAASEREVKGFVSRLVMQTVFDVLELQGRIALLPDAVISAILSQLSVNTTYEPMQCQIVFVDLTAQNDIQDMKPQNCIVVGNTVTGICTLKRGERCMTGMNLESVPNAHLSISGTLSTTNIVMANWSRTMWQNVLNRALRILAAGSFKSHFFSATATVDGN
ncbi:hypothetical protein KIN20_028343 [Parelaphostrongylus tenuis]|uniref:Uncharacterized protein n=1 Tax=Parelaphostrongylus tenuis TaxID=148309 RepID=A0AAD5R0X5_PARTN|nr:hypothetical protein KIN20_028343 [Parelaphostrongylus tenuis]